LRALAGKCTCILFVARDIYLMMQILKLRKPLLLQQRWPGKLSKAWKTGRNNKFIPQEAKLLFCELEETRNINAREFAREVVTFFM
jgi:hypothetical protein